MRIMLWHSFILVILGAFYVRSEDGSSAPCQLTVALPKSNFFGRAYTTVLRAQIVLRQLEAALPDEWTYNIIWIDWRNLDTDSILQQFIQTNTTCPALLLVDISPNASVTTSLQDSEYLEAERQGGFPYPYMVYNTRGYMPEFTSSVGTSPIPMMPHLQDQMSGIQAWMDNYGWKHARLVTDLPTKEISNYASVIQSSEDILEVGNIPKVDLVSSVSAFLSTGAHTPFTLVLAFVSPEWMNELHKLPTEYFSEEYMWLFSPGSVYWERPCIPGTFLFTSNPSGKTKAAVEHALMSGVDVWTDVVFQTSNHVRLGSTGSEGTWFWMFQLEDEDSGKAEYKKIVVQNCGTDKQWIEVGDWSPVGGLGLFHLVWPGGHKHVPEKWNQTSQ